MRNDLVSLILPVYNGERYLAEAIKSIQAQTYQKFELIIIDDSSKDASLKIIQSFAALDERIKVIRNDNNIGLPSSLNVGFKNAKGDYMSWTSHDNCLCPNFISKFVEQFKTNLNLEFVYSDYWAIDCDGIRKERVVLSDPRFLPARNVVGASFMYTRSVYEKIGGYSNDLVMVEDYDYWLRVYQKCIMAYMPTALYEYRFHGESLTQTKEKLILIQKKRLRAKYAGQLKMDLRVQGLSHIYDWFLDKRNPKKILKAIYGTFLSGDLAVCELWRNRLKLQPNNLS